MAGSYFRSVYKHKETHLQVSIHEIIVWKEREKYILTYSVPIIKQASGRIRYSTPHTLN